MCISYIYIFTKYTEVQLGSQNRDPAQYWCGRTDGKGMAEDRCKFGWRHSLFIQHVGRRGWERVRWLSERGEGG